VIYTNEGTGGKASIGTGDAIAISCDGYGTACCSTSVTPALSAAMMAMPRTKMAADYFAA